jgi:hypothetical protein
VIDQRGQHPDLGCTSGTSAREHERGSGSIGSISFDATGPIRGPPVEQAAPLRGLDGSDRRPIVNDAHRVPADEHASRRTDLGPFLFPTTLAVVRCRHPRRLVTRETTHPPVILAR